MLHIQLCSDGVLKTALADWWRALDAQEDDAYQQSTPQHDPEYIVLQLIQLLITRCTLCQPKVYEDWPACGLLHQDVLFPDIMVDYAMLVSARQCCAKLRGQLLVAGRTPVQFNPLQRPWRQIKPLV